MKRIIILLVIVVVAVLAVFYLKKEDKYSTLGKDNDFAVKDTARISRIFLADRQNHTADLTRKGKRWYINNKYKVSKSVMDVFLRTIYGLETQFRPPKNAIPTMVKNLAAQSIKTEIYNDKNQLIRSFYVGGVTPDESGTYMIMEGEEQPFIVGVVGKDGGIRVSFFTDEEKWRDKSIFELRVEEIKSVTVEYPKLKNKSFRLTNNGNQFDVKPFNASQPVISKPLNKSRVESYLTGFKRQIAAVLDNESRFKPNIIQNLPFCIIDVEDIYGNKKNVKLYPIIETDREGREILDDNGGHKPVQEFYAYVDNSDFMIVQQQNFGKTMWAYDYFF